MKINELIKAFVNGATSGAAGSINTGTPSLSISGDSLYSYQTRIARREGDQILITGQKFTATTSKQVSCLISMVPQNLRGILREQSEFVKLEGKR